jgi:hypothetical protein
MNSLGYKKRYSTDGSIVFVDNNGNTYFNNGRIMDKNRKVSNYDYENLKASTIPAAASVASKTTTPTTTASTSDNWFRNASQTFKGTEEGSLGNALYNMFETMADWHDDGWLRKEDTSHVKLAPRGYKKNGGIITKKYQQGGNMNQEQEIQKAFMAFLIEDAAAQGVQI